MKKCVCLSLCVCIFVINDRQTDRQAYMQNRRRLRKRDTLMYFLFLQAMKEEERERHIEILKERVSERERKKTADRQAYLQNKWRVRKKEEEKSERVEKRGERRRRRYSQPYYP